MKFASVLALTCALVGGVFAQGGPNALGKTDAQILSMGKDRWLRFAESKEGTSTVGTVNALGAWTDAAERRNNRLISKLGPLQASQMRNLRTLLRKINNEMTSAGYYVSGGGTMWNIIGSDGIATSEDVLYGVLGGTAPKVPSMVVSKVTKSFDRSRREIRKNQSNDQYSEFKMKDALKAVDNAESAFKQVVNIAKTLDRRKSDLLLWFVQNRAEIAADGGA